MGIGREIHTSKNKKKTIQKTFHLLRFSIGLHATSLSN